MQWFYDLRTGLKLAFGFGIVILLQMIILGVEYESRMSLQASQASLYKHEFALVTNLLEFINKEGHARVHSLMMGTAKTPAEQEQFHEAIKKLSDEMHVLLTSVSKLNIDDLSFSTKIESLINLHDEFKDERDSQLIPLLLAGKIEEANRLLFGAQQESFEKIETLANNLIDEAEQRAEDAVEKSAQAGREVTRILIALGLFSLLVSIMVTHILTRMIAGPIKEITEIASRIAEGDLTLNMKRHERGDEVGILTSMFQTMVVNLRQLTREISETVNFLSTSANEISSTTSELSSSAAETATSVSETTSTIEEVRQTSQLASQKAKSVSDIAQKTTDVSTSGKKAAGEMNTTISQIQNQMDLIADSMLRLSEQSQAIGEIITTVDDLAQQSNLLSVNASIEASKTGEKGFTVVAQEIKSLATQSKQATNQIRAILNDTQKATAAAVMATEKGSKSVSEGVTKATETGTSILTLINSVTEAANAATQIAATSHQQFVGMEQAAVAMENIKQASIQNVEGAKQLEIAASNLKTLGEKLKKLVGQYKLKKAKNQDE